MSAKILVLGGKGFVGQAIVSGLAAAGFEPVRGARSAGDLDGIPTVLADATDLSSVTRALNGMDGAVNAVFSDAAGMRAAAQNLCSPAALNLPLGILHVSSMAVYGSVEGYVSETQPLDHGQGGYGGAKAACEQIVQDFKARGGRAVIVRPGIVYGPGSEQWIGRIGRLLRARRLGDLGAAGDGFCNLVFARDLAAQCAAAFQEPSASNGIYNLGMASPPRWNEFLIAFALMIGATPVPRIAHWQLQLESLAAYPLQLAKLAAARAKLPSSSLPPPIPPSLQSVMRQQIRLDCTKAAHDLGIANTGLQDGLAACAAWFIKTHGARHD